MMASNSLAWRATWNTREEPVWGRMGGLVIKITVPSDRGLEVGCVTVGDYSLLLLKLWVSAL